MREALTLFHQMRGDRVRSNGLVFFAVISDCTHGTTGS
jgi:hypothetical protein